MNDEHLENILSSVTDEVSAPKHRTALRAALMREHARTRRPYFALRLSRYIPMKTAMIPVSAIAVLVLVAAGTFGMTQKSVSAQEVAQRAMTAAARLTPEMRAQIESQMKADMMQALEEAYRAPDLRILTREQYEKEAQFTVATGTPATAAFRATRDIRTTDDSDIVVTGASGVGVAGEPIRFESVGERGGVQGSISYQTSEAKPVEGAVDIAFAKTMDAKGMPADAKFTTGTVVAMGQMNPPVKYLRYTSPDGRKVTLGLDESDTPVFRIEELTASDVTTGPDGSVSIQGKVLRMINVHTQNFDGGYGSAGAVRVESSK